MIKLCIFINLGSGRVQSQRNYSHKNAHSDAGATGISRAGARLRWGSEVDRSKDEILSSFELSPIVASAPPIVATKTRSHEALTTDPRG